MDLTGRTLRLERSDDAPAAARQWMEKLAEGLPKEIAEDVTLLTHELVTNAVRHADGDTLWIAAVICPETVRVEVADEGGTTEPAVLPQQRFASGGHGLLWVDRLSDAWGIDHNRAHSVWFQIDTKGKSASSSAT